MQEAISKVTWDTEAGRPQTKLDCKLDDILESGNTLDYVNLTTLSDANTCPLPPSDTFIPVLDNNSISTFETVKGNPNPTASLSRKHSSNAMVSETTIDTLGSRVSSMVTSFLEIE